MSVFNVPVTIGVDEDKIAREIESEVKEKVIRNIGDKDNKETIAPPYLTLNDIRQLVGLEPISGLRSSSHHITNCKNCGAPLTKNKYCEYCGTQY